MNTSEKMRMVMAMGSALPPNTLYVRGKTMMMNICRALGMPAASRLDEVSTMPTPPRIKPVATASIAETSGCSSSWIDALYVRLRSLYTPCGTAASCDSATWLPSRKELSSIPEAADDGEMVRTLETLLFPSLAAAFSASNTPLRSRFRCSSTATLSRSARPKMSRIGSIMTPVPASVSAATGAAVSCRSTRSTLARHEAATK
mmetsp:Transcript_46304/g.144844  ORF Transcript_46304/g.144844 Transcript_46304/m.144844 type:complete len:203 (+) Transcript_46304:1044-1652(+)